MTWRDDAETHAREYLRSDDYPDGWVTPDEIGDGAAPDLLLVRDVFRLIARIEELQNLLQQARDAAGDEHHRAEAAERDALAVREKMYHNAHNLNAAIERRDEAESRVQSLEAALREIARRRLLSTHDPVLAFAEVCEIARAALEGEKA